MLSCQTEELESYNPDFKGEWETAFIFSPTVGDSVQNYLTVNGRDSGLGIACETDCSFCNCLSFSSGRAKINTKTKELQVGGTVNQIMKITNEPFVNDDGVLELTLNNVAYFKK